MKTLVYMSLIAVLITTIAISAYYITTTQTILANQLNQFTRNLEQLNSRVENISMILENMTREETNITTIIYKPVIRPYSQDPLITINVKVENITEDGTQLKIKVYITNNGTLSRRDLLLVLITYNEETKEYSTIIKYIDEIEPKVTLRYDFIFTEPRITKYYVCILEAKET